MQSDLANSCQKVDCFTWIKINSENASEASHGTVLKSPYVFYGNESSLDYVYSKVSLVVWVGPRGRREEWDSEESNWNDKISDMVVFRLPH